MRPGQAVPFSRRRFSSLAAPASRPVPLWVLYPLFFVFIYSTHYPLLRLPYFWDEAGYYIPAAIDLFRTGSLIPHSTFSNAHPPLPSLLLAGWWRFAGTTIQGTRTFLCMVAAAALLGVFRLARTLAGTGIAVAVAGLTALYPVWFAQSTLAHADLFAAAFSVWALAFYCERFGEVAKAPVDVTVAALFSLAALSKETAIVTPVVLAGWELAVFLRRRPRGRAPWPAVVALLFPILPLAAWYLYHHHETGFIFGNPEFLRYNATANLSPLRILLSLWHRTVHLTMHMNLWVPVGCALALLLSPRLPGRRLLPIDRRPVVVTLLVILAGNALAFSVLGGALLTRYLLPMYPLVLLLCAAVWHARLRAWPSVAVLSAAAFGAALFLNPPYSFAPEDNLAYRDFVVLHQGAIGFIDRQFPQATVLTAWPASTELQHPELGYTQMPVKVTAIDNFSYAEVARAGEDPGAYDTALVFSTKYVPPPGAPDLSSIGERHDRSFFDFHRDLGPREIATILHGDVVWQRSLRGEWAAVLRFPRSVEAQLRPGDLRRLAGRR